MGLCYSFRFLFCNAACYWCFCAGMTLIGLCCCCRFPLLLHSKKSTASVDSVTTSLFIAEFIQTLNRLIKNWPQETMTTCMCCWTAKIRYPYRNFPQFFQIFPQNTKTFRKINSRSLNFLSVRRSGVAYAGRRTILY